MKCLVIGVDGASYNQIFPLIESGRLPTLARLIREGTRCRLRSVTPPQTPAAWTSYATGVPPGAHGIFGWWRPGEAELRPTSGADVLLPRFWEVLASQGVSVGVCNIPMTYPARPINGFWIPGLDSPGDFNPTAGPAMCYPPQLLSELFESERSYRLAPEVSIEVGLEKLLDEWIICEREHVEAAIWAAKKKRVEFLQVNLFLSDFFAHRARPLDSIMTRAYCAVDDLILRLLSETDNETTVFIVSDHGTCSTSHFVMVHTLLQNLGLLKFKDEIALEQIDKVFFGEGKERIAQIKRELKNADSSVLTQYYERYSTEFPGCNIGYSTIDWDITKAFCLSDYGQIWLNKNRGGGAIRDNVERDLIVEKIAQAFLSLRRPDDGRVIIEECLKTPEEVYGRNCVPEAPDITPIIADYETFICQVYSYYSGIPGDIVRPISEVVEPVAAGYVGDHHPFGVLVAMGPGITKDRVVDDASLLDISPTIFRLFEIESPVRLDGSTLGDLWGDLRSLPQPHSHPELSNIRSDLLADRLSMLGYKIS